MVLPQDMVVVGYPDTQKHPMWSKMWQRAGVDPSLPRFVSVWDKQTWSKSPMIVTLGEYALREVTGRRELVRWRGRQIHDQPGQMIYPTLAPEQMLPYMVNQEEDEDEEGSGLSHKPARFQGTWVWDIHQAIKQGTRFRPEPSQRDYHVDPSPETWRHLVGRLLIGPRLSFDIETAYKMARMDDQDWEAQGLIDGQILRISFSSVPGFSVSVSWTSQYLDGIKQLLASPLPKIGWNCVLFDVPKLENEDYHVEGPVHDYQDGFHLVQSDLPKGLEYVTSYYTSFHPWKHLNTSNPGLYSCIDADAALQNAIGIDEALEQNGMMRLFNEHVVELMPYLNAAGKRGNAIDLEYSHALEKEMIIHRDELIKQCQPLIPRELLPRKRYKRSPFDKLEHIPDSNVWVHTETGKLYCTKPDFSESYEEVKVEAEIKVCSVCDQPVSSWVDHMKGRKKGTKKDPNDFNPCKAAGATSIKRIGTVIEWDELLPWNPNSADQVKEYIRHFGHPMGKNRMTDSDSASSKHLEKLAKKYPKQHPIYSIIVEFKKVAKTISTYVYHNYIRQDGLIHSTYKNGPSTWRLAAENVNLTNVGKRESNKWTKRARRQIQARPGHVFVGADSTSIEAVIVGYLINDPDFIKMAGKSIHAWLCCQELGWEFNPETMDRIKTEYKDLYNKMKTAIYLLLYGGDPYLMHMENPDSFPTLKDAKDVQEKIFKLLPKLKEWQDRTRERAKKEGVLTSVWGYKHYFYDVFTFHRSKEGKMLYNDDGSPKVKLGKDGKRCLAFEPQNCAAAFGRDTLVLIGRSKWAPYLSANCFVHDGYTLEVPIELAEEAEQFLVDILTRPVPQLGGLRIGCETEIGYNWAEQDPQCKFWADGNPGGTKVLRKVEC